MTDADIRNIVVVALAEDMGLLDERDRQRDLEKAREIARGLKSKKVPWDIIMDTTSLSLQEVEAL